MTNKYTFRQPTKRKGERQVNSGIFLTRPFLQALAEFCARQSATSGITVSRGNVIQTTIEQRYPELRTRRKQIEKEQSHEKKYLDGIKRA